MNQFEEWQRQGRKTKADLQAYLARQSGVAGKNELRLTRGQMTRINQIAAVNARTIYNYQVGVLRRALLEVIVADPTPVAVERFFKEREQT